MCKLAFAFVPECPAGLAAGPDPAIRTRQAVPLMSLEQAPSQAPDRMAGIHQEVRKRDLVKIRSKREMVQGCIEGRNLEYSPGQADFSGRYKRISQSDIGPNIHNPKAKT